MIDYKANVVNTKPCSIKMNIEIPPKDVIEETDKVYDEIQKKVQVAGFRLGKAPMDVIKKNYTQKAKEQIIENLIQKSVFPALNSKNVEPVSYPRIRNIAFDFEKAFSFEVEAELHPEFKIKNYKNIKLVKEVFPITESRVKERINTLRERNAVLIESQNDTILSDNFVLIDYDAFVDGNMIEEFNARDYLMDLSSPQTLAGFKENLIGAKKTEEKEVTIKFPENHPNKKLADKDVVFKIKIKVIKERSIPALDDEFAKDLGLQNLVELEKKVNETMNLEETDRQNKEIEKKIIEQLLNNNVFIVPASLIEQQVEFLKERAKEYFKQQGIPESQWDETHKQLNNKYKDEAEKNVRLSYILNSISKAENIEVSDEDLKKELDRLYLVNKGKEKEVEKYFSENREKIISYLKEEKLFKFLIENANIKEETKN